MIGAVADNLNLIDAQVHGNQIKSPGWTLDEVSTSEPRLQQDSDFPPPIANTELLLLSDESVGCPDLRNRAAPGKMRRLRVVKREQQYSCPVQEFRGPRPGEGSTAPAPEIGAGNTLPGESTSQFDSNRKTRPNTMRKLINENHLRPATDISVCGFDKDLRIPICAPYSVSTQATVLLLTPCRFCE